MMSEQNIQISSLETQSPAVDPAEAVRWAQEIMERDNRLRLAIIEHEGALAQLRRAAVDLHPDLQKADQILATHNKMNNEIMMVYQGNGKETAISREIPQPPTRLPRSSKYSEDNEILGVPPDDFFKSVSPADVAHSGLMSIMSTRGVRRR